jgi:hypothetical protein
MTSTQPKNLYLDGSAKQLVVQFLDLAAMQMIPEAKVVDIFGENPAVTGTIEDVWLGGGTFSYPTSAAQLSVVSSSDEDGAGTTTGADNVLIWGLDANFNEIQELVTLNGLTPVLTTQEFYRVNIIRVLAGGSTGGAVGTITTTWMGVTQGVITPTHTNTKQALYTVPAGYSAFLVQLWGDAHTAGQTVEFQLACRPTGARNVFCERRQFHGGTETTHQPLHEVHTFPEKADIKLSGFRTSGSANTEIAGGFVLLLLTNITLRGGVVPFSAASPIFN